MKVKKEKGIVGVDIVLSIITVMIFSSLIFLMIFNNTVENVKLKKETMAMIYITEIFEEIGRLSYSNVSKESIKNYIATNMTEMKEVYETAVDVESDFSWLKETDAKIMKKITITLAYQVNGQVYKVSMQRIKVKELV